MEWEDLKKDSSYNTERAVTANNVSAIPDLKLIST